MWYSIGDLKGSMNLEENLNEEQIEEIEQEIEEAEEIEEQRAKEISEYREERREERRRRRAENSFFQKLLTFVNLLYLATFVFVVLTYKYPDELFEYFVPAVTNKYVLAAYPVLGGFVLFANIFFSRGRKFFRITLRIIVSIVLAGMITFIAAMMIYNIDIFYNLLEMGV